METGKIVSFKKAKGGVDKKERQTLALYLDQEQTQNMIERLTSTLDNPRGSKIAVTYYEVEKQWGVELSAFAFVDPIQEPGAYGKQGFGNKPKGRFVPNAQPAKPAGISATNRAKAASALNTEIED